MNYFFLRDYQSRRRALPSLLLWAFACIVTILGAPMPVVLTVHLAAIEATIRANLWLAQHWQETVFTSYGAERLFQTSDIRDGSALGKTAFFLITIFVPVAKSQTAVVAELSIWEWVLSLLAYLVAYGSLNLLVFHKLLDAGVLSKPRDIEEDDAMNG